MTAIQVHDGRNTKTGALPRQAITLALKPRYSMGRRSTEGGRGEMDLHLVFGNGLGDMKTYRQVSKLVKVLRAALYCHHSNLEILPTDYDRPEHWDNVLISDVYRCHNSVTVTVRGSPDLVVPADEPIPDFIEV